MQSIEILSYGGKYFIHITNHFVDFSVDVRNKYHGTHTYMI